jgi:hypothetical protein
MFIAPRIIRKKRFSGRLTREAGGSIKPGVERSGTPGTSRVNETSPRSGRQIWCAVASTGVPGAAAALGWS